jgi:hypothetical protein
VGARVVGCGDAERCLAPKVPERITVLVCGRVIFLAAFADLTQLHENKIFIITNKPRDAAMRRMMRHGYDHLGCAGDTDAHGLHGLAFQCIIDAAMRRVNAIIHTIIIVYILRKDIVF